MRHIMVDIETLGTKPGSVILSIGACRFDEAGIGERFYRPIDVFDSLMAGLTADQATIGWWRMQTPQARAALRPALPLREVLNDFVSFVVARPADEGHRLLWAKGPDFDLVMIEAAFDLVGIKKPWSYRVARDVRTILSLAPGSEKTDVVGTEHNALDDAVKQAHQVRMAAAQLQFALSEMV